MSVPSGFRRNTAIFLSRKLTLPVLSMLPPCFEKMLRTRLTMRVGVSVAASTRTATLCGA
jgi:hypothetical protein